MYRVYNVCHQGPKLEDIIIMLHSVVITLYFLAVIDFLHLDFESLLWSIEYIDPFKLALSPSQNQLKNCSIFFQANNQIILNSNILFNIHLSLINLLSVVQVWQSDVFLKLLVRISN